MDLIERLREIEERARVARKTIAVGRKAGLEINGTTALRDIEFKTRDLAVLLEKQTGGSKAARAAVTTPSSRAKGA
jgi:hypothetical protein